MKQEFTNSLSRVASWVFVSKATGQAVMETFNENLLSLVNTEKYEVVPIQEWLTRVNTQAKSETSL